MLQNAKSDQKLILKELDSTHGPFLMKESQNGKASQAPFLSDEKLMTVTKNTF
jgi:hypothetical protein